ncbi:hypothetical protein BDN71DRAFT_1559699 [Pleurotus eryngii]|uniref:Vacuolar sorting protein 39/Transforming growth factor beta receptor-associated domain-containing protein n=1 Tax=Pleurotus eryngii TaxID=5323 RepID=A0A9P6A0N4_PLEER|nr:hypothetical protein BDN71DRAFT_1559699 [Pleurotus eryngii]
MFHGLFPRSSVLLLGEQQISALLPSTLISQVESLLSSHRIQDAINLVDQRRRKVQESITPDEDESDELRYVYQRIGFQCFEETMFDDAGTNFINGDLDPRLLVSYYPDLRGSLFGTEDALDVFAGVAEHMPADASVDDIIVMNLVRNYSPHLAPNTRAAPPTVELRQILNLTARDMLLSFLRKCRMKRQTLEDSGLPTIQTVNFTVDTVLAKLYILEGRREDLHMLLESENYVALGEVESLLREGGFFHALCLIYKSQNDDTQLLDIWSKLVEGTYQDDTVPDPLSQMIALLKQKRDRLLVQKWGVWLTQRDTERGLELLRTLHSGKRRDKPEDDLATLKQLRGVNMSAAAIYLEYLILVRGNNSPAYHDDFAMTSVDQLISAISDESVSKLWRAKTVSYASSSHNESSFPSYFASTTPDSDHKRTRLKTIVFLQSSAFYDPKLLRERLLSQPKILTLELAIVEGKLSNHRSALQILANDMRDDISAETYCTLQGQVIPPKILRSIADKVDPSLSQWNGIQQPVSTPSIARQNSTTDSQLKSDLLKLLLEVYMMDEAGPANRAARLLNAQAASLDIVDVVSLIPPKWPLTSMSSFLTRSLRRTLHTVHEGQIVKMISSGQNLEVKDRTWAILREQGAIIEEAVEDEDGSATSYDEKSSLSEKVALLGDERRRDAHEIHVNGVDHASAPSWTSDDSA